MPADNGVTVTLVFILDSWVVSPVRYCGHN